MHSPFWYVGYATGSVAKLWRRMYTLIPMKPAWSAIKGRYMPDCRDIVLANFFITLIGGYALLSISVYAWVVFIVCAIPAGPLLVRRRWDRWEKLPDLPYGQWRWSPDDPVLPTVETGPLYTDNVVPFRPPADPTGEAGGEGR